MKKFILLISFLLIMTSVSYSQENTQRMGGKLSGKVVDADTKELIEYANIILYNKGDSSQVTGTITNSEGIFELSPVRPGNYYIDVQFIGYNKVRLNDITISPDKMIADLGTIEIQYAAINLGNVLVEGERSPISYHIDKKVIDVSQMSTTISGNAADVLENVPSVTVDIEGNVSLRGSSSFTVLVDGRPSVLDAQDILQQIPASTIDNIEIITNPSAKYDPEGSSGIINIILKKTKNTGISGVTNLNAGLKDKYGGDFLAEYKTQTFNTNFGLDYNNMFFPGSNVEEKRTTVNDVTSFIHTNGDVKRGRTMFGLRSGIQLFFNPDNVLSFSGRYGERDMQSTSNLNHEQWADNNFQHFFFRNSNTLKRGGYYYAFNLNYLHRFGKKGHEISSEISFRHNNSDEESLTALFDEGAIASGRRSTELGPSDDIEGKIDYVLPLGTTARFEAGYQGELDLSTENTGYYQYNVDNGVYDFFPEFSHAIDFDEREHAFYSMYSNEIDKFGFQAGVRAENTFRSIKVDDSGEFNIDTWDYFPTFHSSYTFPGGQQAMASYTRRIERPRGWALEPFETWSDANTVRRGNPALKPEYVDSYEAGFRTFFGDVSLSTEIYYRVNQNKMEIVRTAYSENVTLSTFENVGTDYSLGSEFMLNFGFGKFWNINLMANLYNYGIEGIIFDENFSRESFNWNSRFNNSIKLSSGTQFQINSSYTSPTVSSQGKREGFFSTDVAVKQDLLDRTLSLTLQVRDIFSTAKHESTSSGLNFYNYSYFTRESPVLMLNIRYNINNYKSEERRRGEQSGFDGEDEF